VDNIQDRRECGLIHAYQESGCSSSCPLLQGCQRQKVLERDLHSHPKVDILNDIDI
jgi:hypothetical protein